MDIRKHHLQQAVERQIISEQQSDALWQLWQSQQSTVPQFSLNHVLYYLGGLLAIGAMTLFMTLGWETFGGSAIVALCLLYGLPGVALTEYFHKRGLAIPAGICAVFVVVLVPLAVYGVQQEMGLWLRDQLYRDYRWGDGRWLTMELALLAAGAAMLWRYRYPFLLMPIAVTLWCISIDAPNWLIYGKRGYHNWLSGDLLSIWFGLAMILLALWVDFRNRSERDYPFWLYLFGVMAFWSGISSMIFFDSKGGNFLYCLINLAILLAGVLIRRRVFVVFAAFGIFGYCFHLASQVFKESWLLPVSLTFVGLAIVLLGIWWQRNEVVFTEKLQSKMPPAIRRFLQRKF